MKPFFKNLGLIHVCLTALSTYIVACCAAMLEFDSAGNLIAHSYSVWGDWSAHFTFISNLLERGPGFLWGDNPVFSGIPFQYPFLSHVITAVIAWALQISAISATYYSSLILMFALPFCLYYWFRTLNLKPSTALVAILLFLFIGGFQYFDSTLNPGEPLTNQFQKGSIFTQFIAFEFFPQRAFLFGLIVFTLTGGFLVRRLNESKLSLKALIIGGLAIALTSWLHLHTWIAFAVVLLTYFIFAPRRDHGIQKNTFFFGAAIALVSAGLLSFLLLRDHGNELRISWTYFQPGWAQNEKAGQAAAAAMNPISFWLFNTALFLPLSMIGILIHRRNKKLIPIYAAGLAIFAVGMTFNIQPYFYDNLKLFTYAFLFLAPFAALAIEPLFSKKVLIPAAVIIIGLQTWSGISDLEFLRSKHQNTIFFTNDEIALAQEFKRVRPSANDLMLMNPRHNHWASCLTGNPVAMGYPGWLWSWGINYGEREREINAVLLGQANMLDVVKKLNISYIVLNLNDRVQNQLVNFEALKANYPVILSKNDWLIFSTKSPASSVR